MVYGVTSLFYCDSCYDHLYESRAAVCSPRERHRKRSPVARLWRKVRKLFKKDPPEDPYAYVMARTKPSPPHLTASAVAELPED